MAHKSNLTIRPTNGYCDVIKEEEKAAKKEVNKSELVAKEEGVTEGVGKQEK
jgi:hypothetical protein